MTLVPSGLLSFLSNLPLLPLTALPGCLPSGDWFRIYIRIYRPQRLVLETKACSMKDGLRNKLFYSRNWFQIHVALDDRYPSPSPSLAGSQLITCRDTKWIGAEPMVIKSSTPSDYLKMLILSSYININVILLI